MDITPEQIAGMDQQMAEFERQAADATHNKDSIYFGRPDVIAQTRAQLQAVRIRAGLAPAVAPKTPQQIAAEQHAQAFPLPDELDPNMVEYLDADRAPLETLAKDKSALAEATKQLKTELGGVAEYDKLLKNAQLYKPTLTEGEKVHKRTLELYASIGLRNQYKRTGKVG
jgi:hypothetical protein